MSIQIHETDNLTIIAAKWEYPLTPIEESTEILENKNRFTLRLHISILINWKIKNIFQQYNIDINKDLQYKLEEYNSFNALCEILNQLWYDTMWFYWKLDWAIEKLFKD